MTPIQASQMVAESQGIGQRKLTVDQMALGYPKHRADGAASAALILMSNS